MIEVVREDLGGANREEVDLLKDQKIPDLEGRVTTLGATGGSRLALSYGQVGDVQLAGHKAREEEVAGLCEVDALLIQLVFESDKRLGRSAKSMAQMA